MATAYQYGRKATLLLVEGEKALDLSEMRFTFQVCAQDVQSPNNAAIRVYNLWTERAKQITQEYSRVVLQAGYESTGYGVIFDGTIKQFRRGRENAVDSYLDILAADGDVPYNFGNVNLTLQAGSTPQQRVAAIADAMGLARPDNPLDATGGVLPRGKVLFGMGRDAMRTEAATQGASWSIQDGKVQIIPLTGYLPGQAVQLNSGTGMIGIPEQTEEGIKVTCLLNPKIVCGGLVQINNADINRTLQQDPNSAPIPYNQWTGIQLLANVTDDGFYRVFVAEHSGDTRGMDWYTHVTCLAVNSGLVNAYG